MTDAQTRTAALAAAATWLAGIDPYPQGRTFVLETADRFAAWVTGDDERDESE